MFKRKNAVKSNSKGSAPPPSGQQAWFTSGELSGLRKRREQLERRDQALVRSHHPQLTPAQMDEVSRRVAVMVHKTAEPLGVPDDWAFAIEAGQGHIGEAAYLAMAEAVENDAVGAMDQLIRELADIGRRTSFVGTPDGTVYDDHHCHIRAREIGAKLNEQGGMELMLAAHEFVARELSGTPRARELEACWGGVGSWMR